MNDINATVLFGDQNHSTPPCDVLIITSSGPVIQPNGNCAKLIHRYLLQGGTVLLKLGIPESNSSYF